MTKRRRVTAADVEGKTFGWLTCEKFQDEIAGGAKATFKCRCGNTVIRSVNNVRSGNTKSCGCLKRKLIIDRSSTHGLSRTPTYNSWNAMKYRCNHNRKGYADVTYDPRWNDFLTFLDDMGERPPGTELDKDKKGGVGCKYYCKENCSWIKHQENNKYKSNSVTDKDIEHFVNLYHKGVLPNQIAKMTGRHVKVVVRYLKQEGVYKGNPRSLGEEEVIKIKEHLLSGLTVNKVAKIMSRSRNAVIRIKKSM